jgi:hypothetical protein
VSREVYTLSTTGIRSNGLIPIGSKGGGATTKSSRIDDCPPFGNVFVPVDIKIDQPPPLFWVFLGKGRGGLHRRPENLSVSVMRRQYGLDYREVETFL